ncbi:LytR/AlgR family response regulator transcription factor [Marinicella sp. W31]|uniref:LytR/AlgR family response regulator transcription factor n=1 Tax=Marinicella sp. W31 TaxID=3023713 RepID=UPI0037570513
MKILVVDDEPLARMRLIKMLGVLGYTDCLEAGNGVEAMQMVENHHPVLVFLDIQMPLKNGMETAAEINRRYADIKVVLCTAFDAYAVEAFEHVVHDYLLKPVSQERLQHCLQKIQLGQQRQTIVVRRGHDVFNIDMNDIICLIADGKYVTAHVAEDEFIIDASLQHYENKYSEFFIRVHRSTLVNRAYLAGIHQSVDNSHQVILRESNIKPSISRRQLPLVRELLKI